MDVLVKMILAGSDVSFFAGDGRWSIDVYGGGDAAGGGNGCFDGWSQGLRADAGDGRGSGGGGRLSLDMCIPTTSDVGRGSTMGGWVALDREIRGGRMVCVWKVS